MLDEAINHKEFIIFCLRRAVATSKAPSIKKADLDNYHGLLLEVSGDEEGAMRYYDRSKGDCPEAEFHYYRLMLDREDLPIGVSLSLMKAAAYKGASVGQLFFGLDSICHDATTAKFWLQSAAKDISQANLPLAASLMCLGELEDSKQVLMRHARMFPDSTLHFVRAMRSRMKPALLARKSIMYAFNGTQHVVQTMDITQEPALPLRERQSLAIPSC
jgi:hypothetical protein